MRLSLSSKCITGTTPCTYHAGRNRGKLESLPGRPSQQVVACLLKELCPKLPLQFRQQQPQGFLQGAATQLLITLADVSKVAAAAGRRHTSAAWVCIHIPVKKVDDDMHASFLRVQMSIQGVRSTLLGTSPSQRKQHAAHAQK